MKPHILATLAALVFLAIGLYLLLPRKNEEPGPLAEQIEIEGQVGGVTTTAVNETVDESMLSTLRQFLDEVVQLQDGSDSNQLNEAYAYLAPPLQESFDVDGMTRDDFVVLFDQETRAFPPTGYEVLDSDVININSQEANVRLDYDGEESKIYNIELERIGNGWKVMTVNSGS
ncbi:MAG TPA: hypothetical protein VF209_04405 [Patescibacteria group bacterium]